MLKVHGGDLGVSVYPGDQVVIKNGDVCDVVVSTKTAEPFGTVLNDTVKKNTTSKPYVVGDFPGKYKLQAECDAAAPTIPTESPSAGSVEPNVVTRATYIIVEPSSH